jgi:hypothetical protein
VSAIEVSRQITAIDQDHYPETVYRVVVVNVPSVFTIFWKMLSGWLDANTRDKVCCNGTNFLKYPDSTYWQRLFIGAQETWYFWRVYSSLSWRHLQHVQGMHS